MGEYLLANIPNSCRYDTFKLVPEVEDADKLMTGAIEKVTNDGGDISALNDPGVKANAYVKQAWQDFEEQYKKYNK